MGPVSTWHRRFSQGTLAVARTAQAATIQVVDRAMGSPSQAPSPVSRLCNRQLDLVERLFVSPAEVIEVSYDILEQLVALHHEFAERLLEVMDTRDDVPVVSSTEGLASVAYLPTGPARS